jgi:hypothetical protein
MMSHGRRSRAQNWVCGDVNFCSRFADLFVSLSKKKIRVQRINIFICQGELAMLNMRLKLTWALIISMHFDFASGIYRNSHDDPLVRPFAEAFSSRLSEVVRVKQPSSIIAVNNVLYVSSFLNDAVLQTPLPLTSQSMFRIFAHGSYCTPNLSACGVLNG